MLHSETRKLLIDAWNKTHNAKEMAECFSVNTSTSVNTLRSYTILSCIRLDGKTAYTVYQRGTTAEGFAEYIKNILLPTLSETEIIVMDNMRSHMQK